MSSNQLSGGRHFSNLYQAAPPSDVYKPPDLIIRRPEMNDVFNPGSDQFS